MLNKPTILSFGCQVLVPRLIVRPLPAPSQTAAFSNEIKDAALCRGAATLVLRPDGRNLVEVVFISERGPVPTLNFFFVSLRLRG
jgi:hypothetical protein